ATASEDQKVLEFDPPANVNADRYEAPPWTPTPNRSAEPEETEEPEPSETPEPSRTPTPQPSAEPTATPGRNASAENSGGT
ncbi:MAG: hypothetical protein ACLGIF_11685, partial [Actinomycetes bacterium]